MREGGDESQGNDPFLGCGGLLAFGHRLDLSLWAMIVYGVIMFSLPVLCMEREMCSGGRGAYRIVCTPYEKMRTPGY